MVQNEQYVDPGITKAKFDIEIERYFQQYDEWQKKGVFLIREQYPVCEFLFLAPKLFPLSSVFAIRIDYTNYDAEAPSIKFINPYNGQLIKSTEIPVQFKQKATADYIAENPGQDTSAGIQICIAIETESPFICHPGFWEFHHHPLHTGESWILHREKGEGKLYRILQVLYDHSTALIAGITVLAAGKNQYKLLVAQNNP